MTAAESGWVTAHIGASGFRTEITGGGQKFIADEPVSVGGTETGPTPYDYMLAALGACTVMTLRIYADRKKWPLEGASVQLRSSHTHEKDCETCAEETVDIGVVERRLTLDGPLTEEQRTRLHEIANRCPVKQTLERGIKIVPAPGSV